MHRRRVPSSRFSLFLIMMASVVYAVPAFGGPDNCTLVNGVITCEGDQSAGVVQSSASSFEVRVQNLSKDIAPEAAICGIKATSQGANGGNGGLYSDGGAGHAGGNVTVGFTGDGAEIRTQGDAATGIFAQSVGGKGGNGGNAYVLGNAGDAGGGGAGGGVTVGASGSISTQGAGSHGILAESAGGLGGRGGDAWGLIGAAGNGGAGGEGGTVVVQNQATITVRGEKSTGIFASSKGGKSGAGGSGGGLIVWGGNGEAAGRGGQVQVSNSGSIETRGTYSDGIFAQSIGGFGTGGGGSGGIFSWGGSGSTGGDGGAVSVVNSGAITTAAEGSNSIFAQSVGGGGGSGAGSGGIISVGGEGEAGGHGMAVSVTNSGALTTKGADARGIFAQSVGAGGGSGAGSGGVISVGGAGSGSGNGGAVSVSNSGSIDTGGERSHGAIMQSIGGGGGDGGGSGGLLSWGGSGSSSGSGGAVTFGNTGEISTSGDSAHGVLAQSLGGGGGSGGGSGGALSFGGKGSSQGNGGAVTVDNSGTISTGGDGSSGVVAQSVGGGGGNGGGSGGLISFGGKGSSGGQGGTVSVTHGGKIETSGQSSSGIIAQSVGGGGGNGAFGASASAYVGLGIGGEAGAGGNGAAVSVVTTKGSIVTEGDLSKGILAQSVGGGGGSGGLAGSLSGGDVFSAAFTVGGRGGSGGSGSTVAVQSASVISTHGEFAHGILAQSVGGGGGSGGASIALSGSAGPSLSLSVGGSGGSGGHGGAVGVANTGSISTSAANSTGILAQSVGGGGGDGGASISGAGGGNVGIAVAFGGIGGNGGQGGTVDLSNEADIATKGKSSHGLLAQSVGGGGGSGGFSVALSGAPSAGVAFGLGGAGGKGGSASLVALSNLGDISTSGDDAHGLVAQSIGGGGGAGGVAISGTVSGNTSVAAGLGGVGGDGGSGNAVELGNVGDITTKGERSHGVLAQSVGGGGGAGGFSLALAGAKTVGVSFGLGGKGGKGGSAGSVDVTSHGAIETKGSGAIGILAQSIGGGGGAGGGTVSLGGAVTGGSLGLAIGLGGSGGDGGASGAVRVVADSDIVTAGDDAHGIFAQSVGGGGGAGGFSVSLSNAGFTEGVAISMGVGGAGGHGGSANLTSVVSDGDIETSGLRAHGIFAQSVGGGGGNGGYSFASPVFSNVSFELAIGGSGGVAGNGAEVAVDNRGDIHTRGHDSHGILAQSIGGGGGNGAIGHVFDGPPTSVGEFDLSSFSFNVGGSGGAAGDGAAVAVENDGNVTTEGSASHGIFAQSIGGGGGNGASAISGTGIPPLDALLEIVDLAGPSSLGVLTVGGNGGSSGNGGIVHVTNAGDVETSGLASHGIFAQSVGGGGGVATSHATGGDAEGGLLNVILIGGGGGSSGNGGAVDVVNSGAIRTGGDEAYGIFAQSVGGGGGVAGNVTRGFDWSDDDEFFGIGLGIGLGQDGGSAGDGGDVTVLSSADIETRGAGAIGIFAQSVGGGGGVAGGVGNFETPVLLSFAGSVGGDGSGGQVQVDHEGNVATHGKTAHAIFAQSAGGTGLGGNVTVNLSGKVTAEGTNAHGILAQSRGDAANGNIVVNLTDGLISGGKGTGAGIFFADGAANQVTSYGTITTVRGVAGMAIAGTTGSETIDNHGTVIGSVSLGAGENAFNNHEGGTFRAGTKIDLGAGNLLTNSGTLALGESKTIQTTVLTGDFVQTASGTIEATVCGGESDLLIVDGGTAALDGTLEVTCQAGAYRDGTNFDVVQTTDTEGLSGAFDEVVLPKATPFLSFNMEQLDDCTRVSVEVEEFATAAKTPLERTIAGLLDSVRTNAVGDLSMVVGSFQLASAEQLEEAFSSLSPASYDNLTRGALDGTQAPLDVVSQRIDLARTVSRTGEPGSETVEPSLPTAASARPGTTFDPRDGWWLSGVGQSGSQDADDDFAGHDVSTNGVLAGYEWTLGRWLAGGSIGSTKTDVDLDADRASGTIDSFVGAAYGAYLWRNVFAQSALSYATSDYENERLLTIGGLERVATASFDGDSIAMLLTGGMKFGAHRWRFEPFASLRYVSLDEDGFTESGAGDAGLIVESRSTDSLASDLGVRMTGNFGVKGSRLVPELLASWNHDFGVDDRTIVAGYIGAPSASVSVDGADTDLEGADLGLGLAYFGKGGWKTSLRYHTLQRADYSIGSLAVHFGLAF